MTNTNQQTASHTPIPLEIQAIIDLVESCESKDYISQKEMATTLSLIKEWATKLTLQSRVDDATAPELLEQLKINQAYLYPITVGDCDCEHPNDRLCMVCHAKAIYTVNAKRIAKAEGRA